MSDDADSHKLLAVVATIHHEGVGEALDDGAIGLAKALDGITTGGVRDVNGGANLDVVAVGKVESATSILKQRWKKKTIIHSLHFHLILARSRCSVGYSRQ